MGGVVRREPVCAADLKGGGSLETDIWTNHLVLGLSYRFGGNAAPSYEAAGVYK